VETDTVTFGAFRPEAFEHAGLFDETLMRNQDDEFNVRLRRAGGRVVLDPDITVLYRPRGSIAGVWRQYFEYGLSKVPVMIKHRSIPTMRGVVPLAFVFTTLVLVAASPLYRSARYLLVIEWALYGSAAVVFTLHKHGEPWTLMPAC
jgi:GT2 family glycosyltransferase